MDSNHINFTQQIDINAALDGGLPDDGVNYIIPEVYQAMGSITAEGLFVPAQLGGLMVIVEDASDNSEIAKVVLAIKSDVNRDLVVGIVNVIQPTTLDAVEDGNGNIDATWANVDVTTQIGGQTPNYIVVRYEEEGVDSVHFAANAAGGTGSFSLGYLSQGTAITFKVYASYYDGAVHNLGPAQATDTLTTTYNGG